MSQYTIEIDYEQIKAIPSINFNAVKKVIESSMQNIVDELKEFGWNAYRNDNEDNLRVRFWFNEHAVKKLADEAIADNKSKFKDLLIGFVGAIFGDEAKKKLFVFQKEIVSEQIKEAFSKKVEEQLLGFKGIPGVSIMKGSKNLFEEMLEQKDTKKLKMN